MGLPLFVESPPATSAVISVAGRTGAVVLTVADIANAESTANKGAASGYAPLDAGSLVPAVNSRVQSVAGRTGVVVLTSADLSDKGVAGGVATLDGSGLVPQSQLPSIVLTDTYTVASQAAMLALAAHMGDVAIRTDLNESFILATNSPGTLGDWKQLLSPTSPVTSVAGRVGAVVLTSADLSDKGAVNGVATLDGSTLVPTAQLGTGTANATTYLAGDRTYKTTPGALAIVSRVAHSALQSIVTTTLTALTWDTNVSDPDGYHSTVTNPTRVTVPVGKGAKLHGFLGRVNVATNGSGGRLVTWRLNGVTTLAKVNVAPENGSFSQSIECTLWYVPADGDYLELMFEQDAGGTISANVDQVESSHSIKILRVG